MTPKQFQRFLDRDKCCLHCGTDTTLIPQHRINRGMGGSKLRDQPSNIIVLCSAFNGLIEADADAARLARQNGWKLSSWDSTLESPVFDNNLREWFILDEKFGRTVVTHYWE